jgi:alcohol dehydrogenase
MVHERTMRALVLRHYGPDGWALEERPVPQPGPRQVLVRVHVTGLNPVDVKTRDGALRPLRLHRLPIIAGNELSGRVVELGPGAGRFAVGQRVCARTPITTMGAFADYVALDETALSPVPDGVDDLQAATIPLAGLTAWQSLDELGIRPGERLFISAGAGGVGTLAIQLAKHRGAHVATTASAAGAELVTKLGADLVIDYRRQKPTELLREYDAALDLLGNPALTGSMPILRHGGRIVSLAGPPEPMTARKDLDAGRTLRTLFWLISWRTRRIAARHQVTYRYLFMHPDANQLDHLLSMLAAGSLTVPARIASTADRITEALDELAAGHTKGKIAVSWHAPAP